MINAAKRTKRPRTDKGNQNACIKALMLFAKNKWSCGVHKLMFLRLLMQQIATVAVQIKSVENFCDKLGPTYNLATSSLRVHPNDIVLIVQTTIKLEHLTRQSSQNADIEQNQATRGQALGD